MINISKDAARRFVETWTGRGHERSESQTFWYQLLHDVFGIDTPANFVNYERPVRLKNDKYIDAYIPSTKVIIEQKSSTEDLRKAKKQSDKEELTPYEQAIRFDMWLPYSKRARWIVISNYTSFDVYDMEESEVDGMRTPQSKVIFDLAKDLTFEQFTFIIKAHLSHTEVEWSDIQLPADYYFDPLHSDALLFERQIIQTTFTGKFIS